MSNQAENISALTNALLRCAGENSNIAAACCLLFCYTFLMGALALSSSEFLPLAGFFGPFVLTGAVACCFENNHPDSVLELPLTN